MFVDVKSLLAVGLAIMAGAIGGNFAWQLRSGVELTNPIVSLVEEVRNELSDVSEIISPGAENNSTDSMTGDSLPGVVSPSQDEAASPSLFEPKPQQSSGLVVISPDLFQGLHATVLSCVKELIGESSYESVARLNYAGDLDSLREIIHRCTPSVVSTQSLPWNPPASVGGSILSNKGDEPPMCAQVITTASHPQTGECKEFPTPCNVPSDWKVGCEMGPPLPLASQFSDRKEVYFVSGNFAGPKIGDVTLDPFKPNGNERQIISVGISSSPVKSVIATVENGNVTHSFPLHPVQGKHWEGEWMWQGFYIDGYTVTIKADDGTNASEIVLSLR